MVPSRPWDLKRAKNVNNSIQIFFNMVWPSEKSFLWVTGKDARGVTRSYSGRAGCLHRHIWARLTPQHNGCIIFSAISSPQTTCYTCHGYRHAVATFLFVGHRRMDRYQWIPRCSCLHSHGSSDTFQENPFDGCVMLSAHLTHNKTPVAVWGL